MEDINQIIAKVKKSCRMEFMGAGFYGKLSNSYSDQPELSKTLKKFSKDEFKHGVMFARYYEKACGKKLGQQPWMTIGKIAAFFQFTVPLEKKLKKLHLIESRAVKQIEHELQAAEKTPYLAILEKILPDEVAHAKLYTEMYPKS